MCFETFSKAFGNGVGQNEIAYLIHKQVPVLFLLAKHKFDVHRIILALRLGTLLGRLQNREAGKGRNGAEVLSHALPV